MIAWKVVGPNLEGAVFMPEMHRKLRFEPGSEVADPHHQGFWVHLDYAGAYRHARLTPATRLVELEFEDAREVWGSGPTHRQRPPHPGTEIGRIRRARVIRELDVDRTGVIPDEVRAAGGSSPTAEPLMLTAWKVVGPNLEGGIYLPGEPRKLIFRPGTEVFDPATCGFCVHTRREEAYRHARCNPGTRLVELEHGDTLDDWGSGPGRPCPNSGWARLRRARVVREVEVDRSDITVDEARTGKWLIPSSHWTTVTMHNQAVDLFERFAKDDPSERALHGVEHVGRVAEVGRQLARKTPGADLMVVAVFAGLHDACRPPERNHGARAADLARSLHRAGHLLLDWQQLATLCAALKGHAEGRTSDDPTIGCCWDADRLDLPRCGIRVDRRFLSTAAAKARLG